MTNNFRMICPVQLELWFLVVQVRDIPRYSSCQVFSCQKSDKKGPEGLWIVLEVLSSILPVLNSTELQLLDIHKPPTSPYIVYTSTSSKKIDDGDQQKRLQGGISRYFFETRDDRSGYSRLPEHRFRHTKTPLQTTVLPQSHGVQNESNHFTQKIQNTVE